MVYHYIKENELVNELEEPEDDVVIIYALKFVLYWYKKLGDLHARDVIGLKVMKVTQPLLRTILSMMKDELPLDMRPINRGRNKNRSAKTVQHLHTAYKLIKFMVSEIINGCSRKIMWLKCSNNNRAETARVF